MDRAAMTAAKARLGACSPPLRESQKSETPGGQTGGSGGLETINASDSAPQRDAAQEAKDFATLQAELALAGWTLQLLRSNDSGSSYAVGRWGMVRQIDGRADLLAFMRQVGAR